MLEISSPTNGGLFCCQRGIIHNETLTIKKGSRCLCASGLCLTFAVYRRSEDERIAMVDLIDLSGNTLRSLTRAHRYTTSVWGKGGILCLSEDNLIEVVDPETETITTPNIPNFTLQLQWLRDENKFLYVQVIDDFSRAELRIYDLETETSEVAVNIDFSGFANTAILSSDESQILLGYRNELRVYDVGNSESYDVLYVDEVDDASIINLAVSPTGNQILFSVWHSSYSAGVYVMNVDGSNLRLLESGAQQHRAPSWRP